MHDCLGCLPVSPVREIAPRLGVSRRRAAELLADGVLTRLDRSTVVGSCLVDRARTDPALAHRIAVEQRMVAMSGAVASHESAALFWQLPLLDHPRYAVVTRPAGAWRGGAGSRVRIAPLPDHHRSVVDGVPCTSLARTVVDVARVSSLRGAVVIGDGALRRRSSLAELSAMVEECAAWSDVGKVRRALRLMDGRAESPLESVSRVIIHERNVPPPQLQVWLDVGGSAYRVDFFWPHKRLIGEADGLDKYADPSTLREEKLRQERLERAGFIVVRWTFRDILYDTDATIARLLHHLR